MTNQVNQEFEKWHLETFKCLASKFSFDINQNYFQDHVRMAYLAATQARESEINSLKERVEELEAANSCLVRINVSLAKESEELTASNNQLREALEICKYDCHTGEVIGIAEKALKATPAQSLAAHDNEVLSKVISLLEDMNANGKHWLPDYIEAIRALKVTP